MLAPSCEPQSTAEEQQAAPLTPVIEAVSSSAVPDLDSGEESVDQKDNRIERQEQRNSIDEIDTEGEDGDSISPCATVVPSNTPVTGDSGHVSPTMESSLDSLSDGNQQLQDLEESCDTEDRAGSVVSEVPPEITSPELVQVDTSSSVVHNKEETDNSENSVKSKVVKDDKKEEKKKSKKKEDRSGEYILRALNSLQSPQEKLAALCKKFADLHEEHRILQTSFKTQQRTMAMVTREKDQLQSEHTKAMMAKSKLESLCRELQKHNKTIENESIKRAKESDDKRKEISAHFNTTINEIQTQMSDNTEKNNILRKENENLAEQLRTFLSQCQARDEHFKKLQEQHDLENKLAAAKLAQAEAIIREVEERSNKEKELMLMKLTEMTKKAQLTETQLQLYKSKYDEFNELHTRSTETFQKYKTEMDKMTKRIKKLEKDGLQWKTKWEASSKTLLEQYEAKSKSEQEAAVCAQKVKKLESLCRALQAELHRKQVVGSESGKGSAQPLSPVKDDSSASAAPPNSPEVSSSSSSSGEGSPALPGHSSSKIAASCTDSLPAASSSLSSCSRSSPDVPGAADNATGATECPDPSCSQKGLPSTASSSSQNVDVSPCVDDPTDRDNTPTLPVLTSTEPHSEDEIKKAEVVNPSTEILTEPPLCS